MPLLAPLASTYVSGQPLARLPYVGSFVSLPVRGWSYAHHPSIVRFGDRLFVLFSQGRRDEDAAGQRVMISSSSDGLTWTKPAPLADSQTDAHGRPYVLTAAGFHRDGATLVAYFARYRPDKGETTLFATETADGTRWSTPRDLHVPICPNHGPVTLDSGRLVTPGNFSFPFTDDPSGLGGWFVAGPAAPRLGSVPDNPATWGAVARRMRWARQVCEGSVLEGEPGELRMLLRTTGHALAEADSIDDGATWSSPRPVDFPDAGSKFDLGRLPDGRAFYVGNPETTHPSRRVPLVVSVTDTVAGLTFDRHYALGVDEWPIRYAGRAKRGDFAYPDAIVDGGFLRVVFSRGKEAIEVRSVPLAALAPSASPIPESSIPSPRFGAN